MGLFDKLLGKTNKKQSGMIPATKKEHEEEWDFYFSNVNDNLGSLFVDLGVREVAPIKDKPNIVWVSIRMNNPREDGLSSQEESGILADIEDALVARIISEHNAVYVGRLTSAGDRDLYFYFGDTILYDKTISEVMVAYPKYEFDYGSKEDKEWDDYFDFLYPTPQQFQSIQNRHVIEQLEKNGDSLNKAREVDHWIYFQTETDRETFLQKISNDGFSIVDKDYDKELDETPFKLHIKRIDYVDQNSVDVYVIYLWKLANELNADYDGWETSIEKD
ncbi:DUF695 domain-containing protein [Chryseobacterium carnipullorum]|uniref:DUF695 domain-containing protein n=4 Tax=Chryseobacterium carnipullorum TaxID=1124835 RepID=A0A3G6NJF7_CHRCU|nr:DUF695 domain-containing protein [Chryseobacterium carnipullorum]AZA47061.1 DUF695 domain-containing protein [Chryseobacterium carnipullorum]AZA66408.1 DUF695 domain-containing protein [Chryseobacterium carnipullorum]